MKEEKKYLLIASILLAVLIISYPLFMGAAYSLADQDARVIPIIEGIKPVIDFLYSITLFLGCLLICLILYLAYLKRKNPEVNNNKS